MKKTIPIFLLLFVVLLGCAHDPSIKESKLDRQMKKAVVRYYKTNFDSVPHRIVIVERSPDGWVMSIGPEYRESFLVIDPNDFRIIKFYPGY